MDKWKRIAAKLILGLVSTGAAISSGFASAKGEPGLSNAMMVLAVASGLTGSAL